MRMRSSDTVPLRFRVQTDTHFRFCFRGRSKVTVKMVEHDGVVGAFK